VTGPSADVLIPLPRRDYDPSEAALSWQLLTEAGYRVRFATPDGKPSAADARMLSGEGLDLWGCVPVLRRIRLLGLALRANATARRAHARMLGDPAYAAPLRFAELRVADYAGLLLPGGHCALGMREYLEDPLLQRFVGEFFDSGKPVAAICHGVVLAARSRSAVTGKSALFGRRTTALTWKLERTAWTLMKLVGRVWDPGYYRTYLERPGEPAGFRSVEAEVTRALAAPADFLDVPAGAPDRFRKVSGLFRDTATDSRCAWVVRDGNYVSARWPGDLHAFVRSFASVLGGKG
jgi:putative intracellular protease/amidase